MYDLSPKDEAGNVALKCKSLIYNSKDNIVVLLDNKLAVIDGLEGYLLSLIHISTQLAINPNLWDDKDECVKTKVVCLSLIHI